MRRALSLAFVSVLALTGCDDDPQTAPTSATTTNSGGNGGWGGAGGDGGDGGNGAGAGMGGMGGVGGQGGNGGMGGAPSWSEQCIAACQKLDQQCNQQNLCGNIGINCGGTPPAEPLECMFGCLSEPTTTCDDFNDWLDANKSPASPNNFIQCVSACPTAAPISPNPTQGCAECIGAMCGSEFAACQGEAACNDNWVQCAVNCTDPACYRQCDLAHPNNSIAPLYSCMCSWTAGQHTNPVSTYVGTGDCTDVCGGLIDPCNG